MITNQNKITQWASKELHGRYHYNLEKEYIDKDASLGWLVSGILYPETKGFMVAIQNQVVSTRNYQKYILKEQVMTDKCRKCNSQSETIEHILSGCESLAGTKYLERHNKAAAIIYFELLKIHKVSTR